MFKDFMGHAIVCLLSSAVLFFLMIILISEAKVHHRNNKIDEKVTIQSVNYGVWGQVPGNLSINYQREVTPYTVKDIDSNGANVTFQKNPTQTFTIDRTLQKPTWSPTKSIIEYTEVYDYDSTQSVDSQNGDTTYTTLNYAAFSTWHQLNNKPRYWYAWSALSSIANIMYNSPMLNLYYSYNAYSYVWSDYDMVCDGILADFSDDDKHSIYYDEIYGMDSSVLLINWVNAMEEKNETDNAIENPMTVYNSILDYYTNQVPIAGWDEDALNKIVGQGSLLWQICNRQKAQLFRYGPYEQRGEVNEREIIQLQWGRADLFSASFLQLPEVTPQPSIGVELIENIWATYPEYGYYANLWESGTPAENILPASVAANLLDQSNESYITLLNPLNMKEFFRMAEEKLYASIKTRFGMTENQSDIMYQYLNDMIDNFLFQGQGTSEQAMYGYLLAESFNTSYSVLTDNLPIQMQSRESLTYMTDNSLTCTSMLTTSGIEDTDVSNLCDFWNDLSSVADMNLAISPVWYCNMEMETDCPTYIEFQANTSFTDDQIAAIYDDSTTGTLGNVIKKVAKSISSHYGCPEKANCTDNYLAALQWGSQGVTTNPLNANDVTPTSDSIIGWSSKTNPFPGVDTIPPEISSYGTDGWTMTVDQVLTLEDSDPLLAGIKLYYNAQRMVIGYFSNNQTIFDSFKEVVDYDIPTFVETMFDQIEAWLLHGPTADLTMDQILNGYDNPLLDKVLGGDYLQGANFDVLTDVLPVLIDQKGPISEAKWGMRTGAIEKSDVCSIRFMNDQPYVNKLEQIFNGTGYMGVSQMPSGQSGAHKGELFDMATTGIQFPPHIDSKDDATIRMYQPHTMLIQEYSKDSSYTLGDEKLPIDTMAATWPSEPNDIGFAFAQFYQLSSSDCGNCLPQPGDVAIMVQNQDDAEASAWTYASSNSKNQVDVQPSTGMTKGFEFEYLVSMMVTAPEVQSTKKCMPLQTLSHLIGYTMPVFGMSESFQTDSDKYYSDQKYVAQIDNSISASSIACIVLFVLFLVCGIGAVIYHKLRSKSQREQREQLMDSEVRRSEMQANAYGQD